MLTNEQLDIIIQGICKNGANSEVREEVKTIFERAKCKPLSYDRVGSKCSVCGSRIMINTYFCPYCGQKVREHLD